MYHVKHGTSSRVSRVGRVSRVSAMVSVRFSGMFNMVQEFGTAVYITSVHGNTLVKYFCR